MTTVLYTGGSGRMATVIRQGLAGEFGRVILYSRRDIKNLYAAEEVVIGELSDASRLMTAMDGVDVVLHFAGIADEAPFGDILTSNIVATYSVFEAARQAGVRRVVYASSHHIIGCSPAGQEIGTDDPVRPDTFYGLSKVFGEGIGRLYHDKWGLEVISLRIGAFRPEPEDLRHLSVWLSHPDGIELLRCSVLIKDVSYLVVYGVSANTRSWWDNETAAAQLGYQPKDDAEDFASRVESRGSAPKFQGGQFADPAYTGGTW